MDLEDFFVGLFFIVVAGAVITLLAFTAAFFVSIGVWPIVAWGWFGVLTLGSIVGMAASN